MSITSAPAGAPAAPPDTPATEPADRRDETQARPAPRSRLRRWWWPAAVALLVVLAALVTSLVLPTTTTGDLDPRSTAPAGSRAVAQVLRAHGVTVDLVQHVQDAVRGAGAGDTVVVVHPELLGPDQLDQLRDTPADLVLVEPDLVALQEVAPDIHPAGTAPAGSALPGCVDPDAVAAGSTTGGGRLYRFDGRSGGQTGAQDGPLTGCYPLDEGFAFVRQDLPAHRVTVLGQSEVLQNTSLTTEGNAALALRVLGLRPTLRWYLPDPLDLATAQGPSTTDLLPTWVRWVFWQLVIAILVALVWRARRLGRVVTEPLPVVVRSAETVEGRARLYRSSHSREHAAAILRTVTLRRLAARLGVPVGAPPPEVARLAAAAGGQDPGLVHAQLLGPAPRDDAGLVALASALDGLERSVAAGPDGYGDRRPGAAPPDPGNAGTSLPGSAGTSLPGNAGTSLPGSAGTSLPGNAGMPREEDGRP